MDFPDEVFTSATVVKDSMMPPHKDVFNDKNSNNLVSPLAVPKGAGVWQEISKAMSSLVVINSGRLRARNCQVSSSRCRNQ